MDAPVGVPPEAPGSRDTPSRAAMIVLLVLFWLWLAFATWAVGVMAALGVSGCVEDSCEGLFLGALGADLALHLLGGIATTVWAWRSASLAGVIAKCLAAAIALPAAAFGIALILFT